MQETGMTEEDPFERTPIISTEGVAKRPAHDECTVAQMSVAYGHHAPQTGACIGSGSRIADCLYTGAGVLQCIVARDADPDKRTRAQRLLDASP